MKEMWDKRYSAEDYAYGTEPNDFFAEQLAKIKSGSILLPAEGEGRNAVYAARMGWDVHAFDLSREGKSKAQKLAETHQVNIQYQIAECSEISFRKGTFDAIGLVYAHFPPDKKSMYHKQLDQYLKSGGIVILEGFSKSHPEVSKSNEKPMGPPNPAMLFSLDEIKKDFNNYEIIDLKEEQVALNEGEYHVGMGAVIRFVGRKK
ncbi:class I SAM-dependent methyltransferase [Saccharicrinis sp. GN24d3]|uniref:class I SAM-dependent methyltransferase n=1 Tax=Saccharicrinis sp. GN24d3 TaxID=3458416 RepID=UPI004036B7B7